MDDIDHAAFRRLDLNLLVAFDVLVAEKNVTRAAARLCIGQPAMSHALNRLREFWGDQILYRDGQQMLPTDKALALLPAVRAILGQTQAMLLADDVFDPHKALGQFRLVLNEPLEALLLPGLMARLRLMAPNLSLSVQPVPPTMQLDHLERGDIRLAVGYFPKTREVHEQTALCESGYCCVYNPALLALPETVTLEVLCRYPHIHTSYAGGSPGLVDQALREAGLRRQVVAHSANPLSLPFVVKQSALLAVLPELVARLFQAHADLRIAPLSAPGLSLPISIVTHRRDGSNPLNRFISAQIVAAMAALLGR
jgi:LysR family transcriptional activator of mexEF-oprN operon